MATAAGSKRKAKCALQWNHRDTTHDDEGRARMAVKPASRARSRESGKRLPPGNGLSILIEVEEELSLQGRKKEEGTLFSFPWLVHLACPIRD